MTDPYRALVDTVLATRRRQRAWLAGGGAGLPPELPADWSDRWRAATDRHASLAEVDEDAARDAVASVVNHVGDLDQYVAWFRDDAARRDRAISETLLYATGLSREVPSRAAQEAWALRWAGDGAVEPWAEAWNAWASLTSA